ncbi:MAG: YdeI/OmpD-associated family protein [Myxococcota bacterium]
MAAIKTESFDRVEVMSTDELIDWLTQHHHQDESVWLVTYKAADRDRYVSRDEVLDALIAFGWIDGVRRKLDAARTMQLISKRRVQHWARTYKERAARLIEDGRMREPGLEAIERSKTAGLWNFMDDVDALIAPNDLQTALAKEPEAKRAFEGFPPSAQRFTLRWIKLAKTEATRAKRIRTTVERAARGEFVPGVRMS